MVKKTLFGKAKSKKLANIITIVSPTAFKRSIAILRKDGITLEEKRGLVLAQNRAGAQLKRKNLTLREQRQFTAIMKVKLPDITK